MRSALGSERGERHALRRPPAGIHHSAGGAPVLTVAQQQSARLQCSRMGDSFDYAVSSQEEQETEKEEEMEEEQQEKKGKAGGGRVPTRAHRWPCLGGQAPRAPSRRKGPSLTHTSINDDSLESVRESFRLGMRRLTASACASSTASEAFVLNAMQITLKNDFTICAA